MPLLPFEVALDRTLVDARCLDVERIPLEQADGRVLAEDLISPRAMPEHDHSAMDGYAVTHAALEGDGPWRLGIAGESRAGGTMPALLRGSACRIFTGAALPSGTDAVLMQEHVERDGDAIVIPQGARPRLGQNVRARGEDLAEGATVLSRGTRLGPAQLGLAAAVDRDGLLVARAPKVTILATGDELRAPGSPHRPGSIPESNAYVVGAIARRAAAVCKVMPFVGDSPRALEAALHEARESADLVVTVGGASVGDHDLVRPTLERLGADLVFAGVSMRPGKPTALARLDGTRVLCLPGNPASATLAFLLFGVPLLRALQGDRLARPWPEPMRVLGTHTRNLGGACDGRDDFLRARLETVDGLRCARLARRQSSGAVTSFAEADALVLLSGVVRDIRDGDALPVYRLVDLGA